MKEIIFGICGYILGTVITLLLVYGGMDKASDLTDWSDPGNGGDRE